MDGNGRIGRFLMNALLASGGYPWTVVRVDNRNKYISTLENTHIKFDMTNFTKFIKEEMTANHGWQGEPLTRSPQGNYEDRKDLN